MATVGVLIAGCGGGPTPTTPTGPAANTWVLSGFVTASPGGAPIDGAIVKVFLGADAGKQAVADAKGHYILGGIHSGTVFVAAGANGYVTLIQPVTITADAQLDFRLPGNPGPAQ